MVNLKVIYPEQEKKKILSMTVNRGRWILERVSEPKGRKSLRAGLVNLQVIYPEQKKIPLVWPAIVVGVKFGKSK